MGTNCFLLEKTITDLLRILIKSVLGVGRHFVKQNKNKIVFHTVPDAADNGWHLYRYMCVHLEGKQFVWLCADPNLVEQRIVNCAKNSDNTIIIKKLKSIQGAINFISAGFIFLTHGVPSFLPSTPNALVIYIWHGMPIKTIGLLSKHNPKRKTNFDYILSTSSFYTSIMSQAFGITTQKVIESGLPRNDALLKPNLETKILIAEKLGFPEKKNMVFWLPTFRIPNHKRLPADSYSANFLADWDEGFLDRLDEAASSSGCIIIVKLHPYDSLNNKNIENKLIGLRFLDSVRWGQMGVDLYDALAVSAGLITDLSSVLIDYAVTGKPIGVTRQAYKNYFRGMIDGADRILEGCRSINDEFSFFQFLASIEKADAFDVTPLYEFNTQAKTQRSACQHILEFLDTTVSLK